MSFNYFEHFGITGKILKPYKKLLEEKKVEVEEGALVDNVWVPLWIPKKRITIWPICSAVNLYDSNIMKKEFEMHKVQIEEVTDKLYLKNIDQTLIKELETLLD